MTSSEKDGSDLVGVWNVPMQDRVCRLKISTVFSVKQVHKIEFEHGTTTGKRVIRVDGKEVLHRDWMFKLVGKEIFAVGNMKCIISVDALGTFAYEYTLEVIIYQSFLLIILKITGER